MKTDEEPIAPNGRGSQPMASAALTVAILGTLLPVTAMFYLALFGHRFLTRNWKVGMLFFAYLFLALILAECKAFVMAREIGDSDPVADCARYVASVTLTVTFATLVFIGGCLLLIAILNGM